MRDVYMHQSRFIMNFSISGKSDPHHAVFRYSPLAWQGPQAPRGLNTIIMYMSLVLFHLSCIRKYNAINLACPRDFAFSQPKKSANA